MTPCTDVLQWILKLNCLMTIEKTDRLKLHRDMFLDAVRSEQAEVKTLQDVVTYICTTVHDPLRRLRSG